MKRKLSTIPPTMNIAITAPSAPDRNKHHDRDDLGYRRDEAVEYKRPRLALRDEQARYVGACEVDYYPKSHQRQVKRRAGEAAAITAGRPRARRRRRRTLLSGPSLSGSSEHLVVYVVEAPAPELPPLLLFASVSVGSRVTAIVLYMSANMLLALFAMP